VAFEDSRSPRLSDLPAGSAGPAVRDPEHLGDIEGAFGTLAQDDAGQARTWRRRLRLLLVIMGPGLVVMGGGNDAGGIATYAQAGQNYGMALLWTLVLLAPILYVNQEMVVRLGAVSGVGHGRLIIERFGKFWAAFSISDLLLLNAITVVTEFIGVSQALAFFGLPRYASVPIAMVLLLGAMVGGSYRYWERFLLILVLLNFLTFPMIFLVHTSASQTAGGVLPSLPGGLTSDLLLFLIAIIGTTVEPWQLFFQQANVVDKRITPRFIRYERFDLGSGILLEMTGAVAIMAAAAFGLAHSNPAGSYSDLGTTAHDLSNQAGHAVGALVALAMLNGSLIGANIVGLTTTYTLGDVLNTRHSLHCKPRQAPIFYGVYAALITAAAGLVLLPGDPLGTIIQGVAALNGVLLPSAIVFLILLCNDKAVLGPWVNTPRQNIVAATIVWTLVLFSLATTVTVFFPDLTVATLEAGLAIGGALGLIGGALLWWTLAARARPEQHNTGLTRAQRRTQTALARATWRMPALNTLQRPAFSTPRRTGLILLRVYLLFAAIVVVIKIITIALGT
jgi:Mn2+/Fe2+ NRAMP family transporter